MFGQIDFSCAKCSILKVSNPVQYLTFWNFVAEYFVSCLFPNFSVANVLSEKHSFICGIGFLQNKIG